MSNNIPDRDLFSDNNDDLPSNPATGGGNEDKKRQNPSSTDTRNGKGVRSNVRSNAGNDPTEADESPSHDPQAEKSGKDPQPDGIILLEPPDESGKQMGAIYRRAPKKSTEATRKAKFDLRMQDAGLKRITEWIYPERADLIRNMIHYANALHSGRYCKLRNLRLEDLETAFDRLMELVSSHPHLPPTDE